MWTGALWSMTTFLQTCKQFPLCISLWYLNAHSSQLEWPLSFISLCLNMLINNSCSLLMYHLGHQGWKWQLVWPKFDFVWWPNLMYRQTQCLGYKNVLSHLDNEAFLNWPLFKLCVWINVFLVLKARFCQTQKLVPACSRCLDAGR